MLLNDVGPLLTAVQFQLSLYDGCRPVYIVEQQIKVSLKNIPRLQLWVNQ